MSTGTGRTQQSTAAQSLAGCQRILVLGRTGSGKTTLARQLAADLDVAHIELDSRCMSALSSARFRCRCCGKGRRGDLRERWVTDGNKSAVRDLVWPRADTVQQPRVCSLLFARTAANGAPTPGCSRSSRTAISR